MPPKKTDQASIADRLDAAIARIFADGLKPTGIFLSEKDKKALHAHATRLHRKETGSTAYLYPCSYADVPLIGEKLREHFEAPPALQIPVRQAWNGKPLDSRIYASNGRGYAVNLP